MIACGDGARLARRGPYRPRPLLTELFRGCYLAFRAGFFTLAAQSRADAPAEALPGRRLPLCGSATALVAARVEHGPARRAE